MSEENLGQPRPLWKVILLSGATGLIYYGWYRWVIQDELRRYRGDWSGVLQQIHFLSQYWAMRRGEPVSDPLAARLPMLFSET
ncbi:MAG: hypothetical protein ACKO7W_23465 [Elainella sp.]